MTNKKNIRPPHDVLLTVPHSHIHSGPSVSCVSYQTRYPPTYPCGSDLAQPYPRTLRTTVQVVFLYIDAVGASTILALVCRFCDGSDQWQSPTITRGIRVVSIHWRLRLSPCIPCPPSTRCQKHRDRFQWVSLFWRILLYWKISWVEMNSILTVFLLSIRTKIDSVIFFVYHYKKKSPTTRPPDVWLWFEFTTQTHMWCDIPVRVWRVETTVRGVPVSSRGFVLVWHCLLLIVLLTCLSVCESPFSVLSLLTCLHVQQWLCGWKIEDHRKV
jgi:hypothetical protein